MGAIDTQRGKRLRELLDAQGWDVADLARAAGVDPSQIYRWLKGEPISSRALGRLAPVLGTSRRYIVSGTEEPTTGGIERVIERIDLMERRLMEAISRLAGGVASGGGSPPPLSPREAEELLDRRRGAQSHGSGD